MNYNNSLNGEKKILRILIKIGNNYYCTENPEITIVIRTILLSF